MRHSFFEPFRDTAKCEGELEFALVSLREFCVLSDAFYGQMVAVELTLLSERRLQSLSGRDFIKKGYSETKRNQMHISEHMARWVGTTVLLQSDKDKFVKTANRWLSVAKMCYEMV